MGNNILKGLGLEILDSIPIGVMVVSTNGEIVFANDKSDNIFGYCAGRLQGCFIEELIPKEARVQHKKMREHYDEKPVIHAMGGGRVLKGLKKSGEEILLQIGLSPLQNNYTLVSFIESTNDVIKISHSNDSLTGLPNRNLFNEQSEYQRKLAKNNKNSLSMVFIDLDNFKHVNDQFGHDIGDKVICEVARLLRQNIRENDIVGRIGGDEFAICLYGVKDLVFLKEKSGHLIDSISSIDQIEGNDISIGASIGAVITHYPDTIVIHDMVHIADKLMYEVKKRSKGSSIVKELI